jgi:hypothetical protein
MVPLLYDVKSLQRIAANPGPACVLGMLPILFGRRGNRDLHPVR